MIDDPLNALRPLHEPVAISWWPPAPGWWLLLVIVLVVALLILRRWRLNALQRAALHELTMVAGQKTPLLQQATAINQLLKRYALVCWPASEVASLTGESWLKFLDSHGGKGAFSQGPGKILLTAPYANNNQCSDELINLARRWIKSNRPNKL